MGNTSDPRNGPKEGAGPAPGSQTAGGGESTARSTGGTGAAAGSGGGGKAGAGNSSPATAGPASATVSGLPVGPVRQGGGSAEADAAAEHLKGRKGPKNPPLQVQQGVPPSGEYANREVVKPQTVKDKDGRDITPGYAGPKNPPLGYTAPSNFDAEPFAAPDPPVHAEAKTDTDPRPGDPKPGHSGGVPTPPYNEQTAKLVTEPNDKQTE